MIGFFASFEHEADETAEEEQRIDNLSEEFRRYIWNENGLKEKFEALESKNYGDDLRLILLQFLVFPGLETLQNVDEVERYRPKEKSIGINIAVTREDFFDKDEKDRKAFLSENILWCLSLVSKSVQETNLDTNIAKLKTDIEKVLL